MESPSIRIGDPDHGGSLVHALRGYPLKREIDVVIAIVILVLMLPVGALICLLILASGRSIFYVTPRRGAGGRVFPMYKFRTMVQGADALLETYLESDRDALMRYRRAYKIERDPRVTWIGRFLRRFSLDELPQLLNVLRGDMSLVGPRPRGEREFAEEAQNGGYLFEAYYLCRPGMTGPWQISGRSGTDYQTRIRLDFEYAREMSFRRDLVILAWTVPAALIGNGAY